MRPQPVPTAFVVAVAVALTATALVLSWRSLALAGDGSYYLVRVLASEDVFGPWSRVAANAVRQAPVLAAVRIGATDTSLLALLLGFGQLLIPAIVWYSRRRSPASRRPRSHALQRRLPSVRARRGSSA